MDYNISELKKNLDQPAIEVKRAINARNRYRCAKHNSRADNLRSHLISVGVMIPVIALATTMFGIVTTLGSDV